MAKHMTSSKRRRIPVVPIVLVAVVLVGVGLACWLFGQRAKDAQTQHEEASQSGQASSFAEGASANSVDKGESMSQDAAPASELARMMRDGEVGSIRLVGDSITAGFGTDGYDEAVAIADDAQVIYDDGNNQYLETPASVDCWANAFRRYAQAHGVRDFVNAGVNGAFMKQLATNPDAWLGDGADVVFVALGTNDAGYYGPDEYRADATSALAAAAQKSKLVVALAPVRDLRPEYLLVEPAEDLGDVLESVCEEHGYVFVDPRDAVTSQMFNSDGLHPNTEGSLAIWQCIQQTLGLD